MSETTHADPSAPRATGADIEDVERRETNERVEVVRLAQIRARLDAALASAPSFSIDAVEVYGDSVLADIKYLLDRLAAWEEMEASCCPPGVNFDQHIAALNARIDSDAKEYHGHLAQLRSENDDERSALAIEPLVAQYGNAMFDLGAWEDGDTPPYMDISAKMAAAREALLAALRAVGGPGDARPVAGVEEVHAIEERFKNFERDDLIETATAQALQLAAASDFVRVVERAYNLDDAGDFRFAIGKALREYHWPAPTAAEAEPIPESVLCGCHDPMCRFYVSEDTIAESRAARSRAAEPEEAKP